MQRVPDLVDRYGDVLARVTIVTFALLLVWWARNTLPDDPPITFRVARNIAEGHGMVYNVGERHQATSGPGYALTLALIALMVKPVVIPTVALFFTALGSAFAGIGLYELGKVHREKLCGFVAALFFVTSPLLVPTVLNEILPQLALIIWGFVFLFKKLPIAAAILLAFGTLYRPDGALAVLPFALTYIALHRKIPWKEALVYSAVLLPFAGASYAFYGFVLPPTMHAKVAQVIGGINPDFWTGLEPWIHQAGINLLYPSFYQHVSGVILLVAIALLIPKEWRFWWPILAWLVLHALFYSQFRVAFYYWYASPLALGLGIVAAVVLVQLWRWARATLVMRGAILAGFVWLAFAAVLFLWREGVPLIFNTPEPKALYGTVFALAVVLLVLLLVVFCRWVWGKLVRLPLSMHSKLAYPACTGLFVVGALAFYRHIGYARDIAFQSWRNEHTLLYQRAGEWLLSNAAPGTSVGHFEIGVLGWTAPHVRIVDPLGLGSPASMDPVRKGDLYAAAYRAKPPDIILVHLNMTREMDQGDVPPGWRDWFHSRYELAAKLQTNPVERMHIYRKRS